MEEEKIQHNPLNVEIYIDQIINFVIKKENDTLVHHNYFLTQPEIKEKMRSILVDWLIDVHLKFKLVPETLYLTVSIIDRYLEMENVSKQHL